MRKPLTFSLVMLKYTGICKDNTETKQYLTALCERGMVEALGKETASHFCPLPGRTGTGAPVTERLRCPPWGRIRVVPRFTSPLLFRGGVFVCEVCSMPSRKQMRLAEWNYSTEGIYFLTICAKERKAFFSQVVGCGILDAPYVQLTKYGESVQRAMLYLSEHTPNICLEKWVIMPNHVHILVKVLPDNSGASRMPRPTNGTIPKFVSALKRFTNKEHHIQLWQNGYFDHIVRDEEDFLRIWRYIDNNPAVWLEDKYYV